KKEAPANETAQELPSILIFPDDLPEPEHLSKQALEERGWSFFKQERNGKTVRMAKAFMPSTHNDDIVLQLAYVVVPGQHPIIYAEVLKKEQKDGAQHLAAMMVPGSAQITTMVKLAPPKDTADYDKDSLPDLSLFLDNQGKVLGGTEQLSDVLARAPTVQISGLPIADEETMKRRQHYYKALHEAKKGNRPITDDIKALRPETPKIIHYEFELTGWGSALQTLKNI
ncbi:hypothetical protein, partial [Thiolapillus sp.]